MPHADHDPFEERFAHALRDLGGGLDTTGQDLAARGEARGLRLRSRRRAAVAGSVAAVALVGLGGALVLPGGQGDGGRRQDAAASPVILTDSTAPVPAVSGGKIIDTLEKLLPKGRFSNADGRGTDDTSPYAQVVYDDGRGEAAVAVTFRRLKPGSQEAVQTTQCPDKLFIVYDDCSTTKLADGSAVMVLKGYEYPNSDGGTKLWTADLVTPAGQHVSVREWNAAAEKDSPVTRADPPLTAVQLKALATAHEWRAVVDAVPVDPRAASAPPARSGSVSATLAGLVPHGVEVVSKGSADPGFGYVVLDDGRGASMVQLNVQPDMRKVEDQLFDADATIRPDGTKVAWHKGSGEKGIAGITMWTVDTIRPDGRRVVVSAFNSGSQHSPATREAPALTMKQLQAIALSPKWRKLG